MTIELCVNLRIRTTEKQDGFKGALEIPGVSA